MDRNTIQVSSVETVEDDMDEAAVTLLISEDHLLIWFESGDGECTHSFTEEQFKALVAASCKLTGWAISN